MIKLSILIQDCYIQIIFQAGSGLQPNVIKLSDLPQKSPLEKGDKGGCF